MAGAGHKLWAAGDVVGATGGTSINTYLQDQIVGVYADSSARDAAFGGAGEPTLAEGMACWLSDANVVQVYDGSAWVTVGSSGAWSTWTPTLTNWAIGNGAFVARYQQLGKTVHFALTLTVGSTTSYSGTPYITAPVAPNSAITPIFDCSFQTGGTVKGGHALFVSAGDIRIFPNYTDSAGLGTWTAVTSSVPYTWSTGMILRISGTYEAA